MATIYIEGKPYTVPEGQNLLHACLSLGFDIPYFCWHPALQSVGACRLCAVKQFRDEHDTQGRLVMSCMTPATEGLRISVADPEAQAFRAAVIERLMVNHPHDCPICDEGGECHLQDMTVMTGHVQRRFRFRKRTHRNQYLGPFVNHEMNRCIACYRCVRFYRGVAGGRDLDVFGAHDQVYFGRHEDGVLESEFSGNLVEICPTGVFTDKTLKRHYTRKWDLQTAPAVCVHCGLGCNTIVGERYGTIRRVLNRYHPDINGYFLCDRGRFGYEFLNSPQRLRQPLLRRDGALERVTAEEATAHAVEVLRGSRGLIGVGSPRASLEANFALRALVGSERFHTGLSDRESRLMARIVELLQTGPVPSATLQEVARADAVLVLGEDVTNTAPLLALALRQELLRHGAQVAGALHLNLWDDTAVRQAAERADGPVFDGATIHEAARQCTAALFLATPCCTGIDDAAADNCHAAPQDLARLGYAVAHALNPEAPPVPDLSDELRARAECIAEKLGQAERPVVISGPSSGSVEVLEAAANVALALHALGREVRLCFTARECNSLGVALLGGGDLSAALEALESGEADTVIVLENDLFRRGEAAAIDALLSAARRVIVLDHIATATTDRAEIVLPVAAYAEGTGTLVNNEGRAQRTYRVFVPEEPLPESWRQLRDMGASLGHADMAGWRTLDDVTAALSGARPVFGPVAEAAPSAAWRLMGQRIARQSLRSSGRTAMRAQLDVHEPAPPADPDSPLALSMEGHPGVPPGALTPRYWAPGWNSVQALTKYQAGAGGPLLGGDPGRRLLEPSPGAEGAYFDAPPAAFSPRAGELLVASLHRIFGSEELSALAEGIAEVAARPFVGLNPSDAQALGLAEGDEATVTVNGIEQRLPTRVASAMPRGTAGLPVGVAGVATVILPAWGTVRRT